MRVLIACEESQTVCKAFRARGHEAYSNDIQDCSGGHPEWHLKMDAMLALRWDKWDLVIAHPPCTRLANSGVRWLKERDLWKELAIAVIFFRAFIEYGKLGGQIAIENPIPHKYAVDGFFYLSESVSPGIGKYNQIIQPWQFGHGETKATCLWLFGVPELIPTNIVIGRESRIHKMAPTLERSKLRSVTYKGIANAMAEQWSDDLTKNNGVQD